MQDTTSKSNPPDHDAGLFGTRFDPEHDTVVVIGVPWEVTVSYGRGCSATPTALVQPSHQLDFFDLGSRAEFGDTVGMVPLDDRWVEANARCSRLADPIIAAGGAFDDPSRRVLDDINAASAALNAQLRETTEHWQARGKRTCVLGGDHSAPLGHIAACLAAHPGAGILHFDAHHDLREAYEGFTYSHASIMYNVLKEVPELGKLTSVGIRDFCKEEYALAQDHPKVATFYDQDLQAAQFRGTSWHEQCLAIIDTLPEKVYVSFDIDGLQPAFCPHTGTPVPGGLDFAQAAYLLDLLPVSGRTLIGFDLCEVAPNSADPEDEWDLNVGARLLWRLCRLLAG